jgi:NADPH:quinone reductase-like Zn-dependent oxidoreductase
MRAVWLKEFGGPEVLVAADAPDPVAGPGQALIEVAFANITFVETQFRTRGAIAKPAPGSACPATFGNTDIFAVAAHDPTPGPTGPRRAG